MNHQLKFKNMRTGDKIFDILNYTLLTVIMVVVLYPVLYIVAASFSDPQAVVSGEVFILPVRPTLRGYEAVFKNKKILTGFANSVYYLVVGTLLNLVMTMLCAYPLSRKEFRARGGIAMFFVFTMYFSGGLVPSYILVNSLHLTNTRWAMIIPSAMSTYNMIICRTYMSNSIPDEMYEAAQIDGAGRLQRIRYITFPGIKASVVTVLILSIGGLLGGGMGGSNFDQSYIFGNTINNATSEIMQTYAFKMGLSEGRFAYATAADLIQSMISVGLILISNKVAKKVTGEGIF